jgi:hypothetical protein
VCPSWRTCSGALAFFVLRGVREAPIGPECVVDVVRLWQHRHGAVVQRSWKTARFGVKICLRYVCLGGLHTCNFSINWSSSDKPSQFVVHKVRSHRRNRKSQTFACESRFSPQVWWLVANNSTSDVVNCLRVVRAMLGLFNREGFDGISREFK